MYIIERIIALFIYVLTLFIMCYLVSKIGRKYLSGVLWMYVILLSIMSFFYVPASGADLYRLIPIMHSWAELSFSELFYKMSDTTTPVYMLYMNIIGKTQIDGLLPAITAFLFYSNVFYILKKSSIRYNVSPSDTALALFFFMSIGVLIEVISGIRTMLGFSIIAVCLYKELIEGKAILKNIIWYMLASLLHHAVMVLTIIRLSYLLFEKSKTIYHRIFKVIFVLACSVVIFGLGKVYIAASYEKAINYLLFGRFSYFWEYLIGIIVFLFIVYMIISATRLIKRMDFSSSIENVLRFSKYLSLLLVVFFFEYNTFHRFGIFLSIISIPILLYLLKGDNASKITKFNFRQLVFVISCILLILACARGNLTSLKFFVF